MEQRFTQTILWSLTFATMVVITVTATTPPHNVNSSSPRNLTVAKEFFVEQRFHRNDRQVPFVIRTINSFIKIIDLEPKKTKEMHHFFSDLLNDLQNKTIIEECGALKVLDHYKQNSESLSETNDHYVSAMFTKFFTEIEEKFRHVVLDEDFLKIFHNDTLRMEIYKRIKFSPVCCKFWNGTAYIAQIIDGKC